MAPAFCGCHILPRSGSDQSLNVRHHVYASSSAPLFVSRSEDAVKSSFRSTIESETDYECLRSIFAPLDEPLSYTNQTQTSSYSKRQQARSPSKASLVEFGGYMAKTLSQIFRSPRKSNGILNSRNESYTQEYETTPDCNVSQFLERFPSPRMGSNQKHFDSDASAIATPTMLSRLKQDAFPFCHSPCEAPVSKTRSAFWADGDHEDDVFSSVRSRALSREISTSIESDNSSLSDADMDTSIDMPSDLCVQLPSLARLMTMRNEHDSNVMKSDEVLNEDGEHLETQARIVEPTRCAIFHNKESGNYTGSAASPDLSLLASSAANEHGMEVNQSAYAVPIEDGKQAGQPEEPERRSQESIHLYNMRISQHLRSFSAESSISYVSRASIVNQVAVAASMDVVNEYPAPDIKQDARDLGKVTTSAAAYTKEAATPLYDGPVKKNGTTTTIVLPAAMLEMGIEQPKISTRSDCGGSALDTSSELSHRTSSARTVGGNHNEAALLWERALQDHHSRLQGHDSASTSGISKFRKGSNASTLRSLARSSSREERRPRSMPHIPQLAGFKPIDTRLSFDRLAMPERTSGTTTALILSNPDADTVPRMDHNQSSLQTVARNCPSRKTSSVSRVSGQFLTVPGQDSPEPAAKRKVNENDMLETATQAQQPAPKSYKRLYPSSLDAWSRYPSHTKAIRNGPAGLEDEVITRDFASSITVGDDGESLANVNLGRKRNNLATRFKRYSLLLTKKLVTDLPSHFKSQPYGHRSSIALAGRLEYPELELLPPIQSWPAIAPFTQPPPTPVISSRGPSDEHPHEDTGISSDVIGSENYSFASQQQQEQRHSHDEHKEDLEAWSSLYQGLLCPVINAPATEDHDGIARHMPATLATKSLPLLTTKCTPAHERRRSASAEELRMSTVDLFNMLENKEGEVREHAFRAADLSWD